MKSFRKWLIEKDKIEINEFYSNLEKYTTQLIRFELHGGPELREIKQKVLNILQEGIIEPYMIRIDSYDETKLNKEFKKDRIIFNDGYNLKGHYDKQNDEINIYYSSKDSYNEIEAMIGHEFIHKIQHKKSGENFFKQSEKEVNEINKIVDKMTELSKDMVKNQLEFKRLREQYDEKLKSFNYLSSYEKMAYAYQYVKMNKGKKPNEILDSINMKELRTDIKFKKYIGMYWLIKDKI